ncbi:unnamed protein product [Rotaria socialis]|uniref:GST N-terminal domain-containing protein n=1 Tax=Rotaria socialis TaxID=392032 RepID=A0A820M715_9BILA|nr:unnamed protein product [Rotaria socialis]CAF3481115.1 unnamed protein product [Rotaria socialis]CAF4368071.1 unnamed protein product [Rotaria socialis]CAF4826512.1 unnamed protein product [Rotaria socialis]
MESLRLYQIPWSHYCDKVRWALDLKEIPYEQINYNIFGGTKGLERAPKSLRKLMPIIEDPNNKDGDPFRCDSTPILLYLDGHYPRSSISLFPSSPSELRQQVIDTCLRLDSELGLYARRLTYVEILNEKPGAMSILFGEKFSWAYNPDDIRSRFISSFIACFMIARYRLHRIREEQLKEKTEKILLDVGHHLGTNDYLVGDRFSAADLTFCSLIKPLERVPAFINDHRFRIVFEYHERIRRNYDPKYPNIDNFVEKMADKHRAQKKQNEKRFTTRLWAVVHRINFVQRFFIWFMTLVVSNVYPPVTDDEEMPEFQRSSSDDNRKQEALNDQRLMNNKSIWSMIKLIFKYQCHLFFTIPNQAAYLNRKS